MLNELQLNSREFIPLSFPKRILFPSTQLRLALRLFGHRAELCHEPSDDSLVEREGEAVRRRSDLVLRLHVVHLLGVRVVDGHHPVAHAHAGLGSLAAWGQLDREHRAGSRRRLGLHVCVVVVVRGGGTTGQKKAGGEMKGGTRV